MNYNFIKTTDVETANELRKSGLQEIDSGEVGVYMFLNRKEMQFSSDVDSAKIRYTNKLCI